MATALVRWFTEAEGGRPDLPPGPTYAATAVFIHGDDAQVIPDWPANGEHFSVLLDFDFIDAQRECQAATEFMTWSLVEDQLRARSPFLIMEGGRPVAEGRIIAIFDEPVT
jgi:hypothetical protein